MVSVIGVYRLLPTLVTISSPRCLFRYRSTGGSSDLLSSLRSKVPTSHGSRE